MSDDTIWVPGPRHPGPRSLDEMGVASVRFTVRIMGQRQLDVWSAMRGISGRRNHQLAADILLDAIRAAEKDPQVAELAGLLAQSRRRRGRRRRAGLRVLPGGKD